MKASATTNKSMDHVLEYFKLVKVSDNGSKIGYYNSDIDPESSWPTTNVDLAQILSTNEIKGIIVLENIRKRHFNLDYSIHQIRVY